MSSRGHPRAEDNYRFIWCDLSDREWGSFDVGYMIYNRLYKGGVKGKFFGERVQTAGDQRQRVGDEGTAGAQRVGMSERGPITWA